MNKIITVLFISNNILYVYNKFKGCHTHVFSSSYKHTLYNITKIAFCNAICVLVCEFCCNIGANIQYYKIFNSIYYDNLSIWHIVDFYCLVNILILKYLHFNVVIFNSF